jgi:hypothetical protein
MLETCQEYTAAHNLKYSTDPNQKKCKTKCMAFLAKKRELPSMMLCGNPLPWVDRLLHLGNMVSNQIDGGQADINKKAARYIDKNCNISQEFFFAHPIARYSSTGSIIVTSLFARYGICSAKVQTSSMELTTALSRSWLTCP